MRGGEKVETDGAGEGADEGDGGAAETSSTGGCTGEDVGDDEPAKQPAKQPVKQPAKQPAKQWRRLQTSTEITTTSSTGWREKASSAGAAACSAMKLYSKSWKSGS